MERADIEPHGDTSVLKSNSDQRTGVITSEHGDAGSARGGASTRVQGRTSNANLGLFGADKWTLSRLDGGPTRRALRLLSKTPGRPEQHRRTGGRFMSPAAVAARADIAAGRACLACWNGLDGSAAGPVISLFGHRQDA